jgi:putative sterol carrier protein
MANFGTIGVYEELAKLLNHDDEWAKVGANLNYSMIFNYREPVGKSFFLRLEEGKVPEVRELSGEDSESADFVMAADPDTWRAILEKKTNPTVALARGKIKVEGNVGTLMKNMKAFSRILDVMSAVPLDT